MEGSRPASATGYRPSSMHATYPGSSSRHRCRPHDTALREPRDQQSPTGEHLQLELPITYTPFKFESRRVRIDWRLLHGVEISKLVRDTDLDTLERLVSVITWGDIEAEDTRHLSEGNFVKVFRLAQLLLEYLLYVQENLKFTNGVLEHGRSSVVQQAQALTSRCRELYRQLKHCKRELKRASKTAKTYELMAAAVGSTAAAAAAAQAATVAAATAAAAPPPPAAQQQQQQQVSSGLTAGEVMLQGQLTALTERLALAVCEAERLRDERQELQYQIRHLHDTLAAKLGGYSSSSGGGGGGSGFGSSSPAAKAAAVQQHQAVAAAEAAAAAAADELEDARALAEQLQAENEELRLQLQQQSCAAADAAAGSSLAALQAQLEAQGSELVQLQGELREREATIKVFETSNAALQVQLEALQRQHAAPEAATPSFVAKQRQQLAAAAAAQGQLQAENVQLAAQVLELRRALDKAGGAGAANEAASANEDEDADDPLGAAERMLRGSAEAPPSAAAGSPGGSGSSAWKEAEIERLQQDNRQLVAKVTALQERLHELERENGQLQRRCVSAAASPAGEAGVQLSPRGAVAASGGWNSVSSSGPAAELTAADLALQDAVQAIEAPAPAGEQQPEQLAAGGAKLLPAKADAAAAGAVAAAFGGASSGGGSSVIAAYRPPQEAAPPSSPVTPPPAAAAAAPAVVPRGSIDQAAASQMRALMAQLSADMTPEQLAEEYAELASDWDKPFDLTDEEKADFRALLPHEADGLPHVLTSHPTPGKAITANKARLLGSINRQLDAQLASYGIHPGRTGLSNLELLAATKMLSDRRAAQEASLSQAERDQLEVTRLALMLHPYNALQATLAGIPEGPEGKRRLPPQEAALVSAVRPPAAAPALKLHAGNNNSSSSSALPSPTMVVQQQQQAQQQQAAVYAVSGGEAGSPTRAPYSTLTYHAAAAAAPSSPGAGSMRSPSPLGSEANGHPAVARAAGSGAAFSPMSAALAARHRPLGGISGGGGGAAEGGVSAAAPPAGVELFAQQRSNNTAAAAAAAMASKQYLTASFASDDF